MSDKIELVNQSGSTSIFIDVRIKKNGDLLFSGQDIGDAPSDMFGDSDYEYWLTIPAAEKDKVLLALIETHYGGDAMVITKLRKLMESKKNRCKLYSH